MARVITLTQVVGHLNSRGRWIRSEELRPVFTEEIYDLDGAWNLEASSPPGEVCELAVGVLVDVGCTRTRAINPTEYFSITVELSDYSHMESSAVLTGFTDEEILLVQAVMSNRL